MAQKTIKRGSTDQSVALFIFNATTGAPRTSMTHTAPGLSLWYRREKGAKVTLTAAALTSLSAAHADGGFEEIGNGSYRLDLPDAAVAASSGVNGVLVGGTATSVTVVPVYVELPAYDPFDGVRLGITALPNAAASAAGGLPVSTAGGFSLDSRGNTLSTLAGKVVGTIATGTHNPQSGDAYARIGSNGASLSAIPWNASWDAQVESEVDDALGGGTGTALTSVPWNAAWDAEVQSEVADALTAYNPPTYTEMVSAIQTAGTIADAVWDELRSEHTSTGTYGDVATVSDLNAEIVDALTVDTISQPGQESPSAAQTIAKMLAYLYKAWRNKSTQTSSQYSLLNDDAATVDQKATVSDDGTTFSKGEVGTGP